MKKHIYTSLAIAAALLSLASCNRNELVRMTEGVSVAGNTVTATLTVDDPVCLDTETGETMTYDEFLGSSEGTKSVYGGDDDIKRISNLALAIYDESKDSAPDVYWFSDINSVKFALADRSHTYTIYTFANFFKDKSEASSVLSGYTRSQMDGFKYKFSKNDTFKTWGFPMAKKIAGYSLSNPQSLSVKVLACKVGLRIKDLPSNVKLTNFTFKLQASPNTVMPFADKFSVSSTDELFAAEKVSYNDVLSAAEIQTLASGGTVYMYLLENMMGDLMPGNTDVTMKEPDNVNPQSKKPFVSFYQINTDVTIDDLLAYSDVKFRFALGKDNVTNFDCPRNHCLSCALSFSDLIYSTGWYVDANEPILNGDITLSKSEAGVIGNVIDRLTIDSKINKGVDTGTKIDFEIVVNEEEKAAANLSVEIADATTTAKTLTFKTTEPINGIYPFGSDPTYKPVHITVQTVKKRSDGTPYIKKEILVKVYNKAFPIMFRVDNTPSLANPLMVYAENPLNLPLAIEAEMNYGTQDQQYYAQAAQTDTKFYRTWGSHHKLRKFYKYSASEDNTLGRTGKVLFEATKVASAIGSTTDGTLASGADGIRLDIRIFPITENTAGSINLGSYSYDRYPKMPADAKFWTRRRDIVKHAPGISSTLGKSVNTSNVISPADLSDLKETHGLGYSENFYHNILKLDVNGSWRHYNNTKDRENPYQYVDGYYEYIYKWTSSSDSDDVSYALDPFENYAQLEGYTGDSGYNVKPGLYTKKDCWGEFEQYGTVENSGDSKALYDCPFVVINGGMIIYDVWEVNCASVGSDLGEVQMLILMYEPGRDLGFYNYGRLLDNNPGGSPYIGPSIHAAQGAQLIFFEKPQPAFNDNDYTTENGHYYHRPPFRKYSCFGVVAGSRAGAVCKGWDKWKGFHFGTFMTVNGCSIWPGADGTCDGCANIPVE